MERNVLGSSTSKARRNGLRKVSSLKKIVPHPKKTVIMKNNSTEEYYLWPSTINKRHLTEKEMKKNK